MFYCIIDRSSHELSFTNAGHEFPFVVGAGEHVRRLETGGLALGMLEDFPFQEEVIQLLPDDVVVICSDGVSEAMNPSEERFGDARVEDVLKRHRHLSPNDLIEKIVESVRGHAGTAPQMDDITIVIVKRTS